MSDQQYAVLIPVKPPAFGKSRLADAGSESRRALAEAFALDTVSACVAAGTVAQVLVVTDDVQVASAVADLGAAGLPDGVSGDLNGTLRQAAAEAARRWPHLLPVALCADLPALRADDLDATLGRILTPHPWFVPDAAGVGTTMYAASCEEFDPRFGPGSRAEHRLAGAHELTDVPASVRRDVDDLDDLRAAMALGLGPHTAAVLSQT
ncbi:2-phospho-L-lactate guanylyltransferase [Nocardioides sp.]|uniref:2-phospho-L-lactate guanylyltransferase n=1 Tax=Nocardioides sp. TaxID=35761 RepID=UPI0025D2DE3E|nr:2-phospho-L-lactate guanylyltransferase [Nocardioides sp.]